MGRGKMKRGILFIACFLLTSTGSFAGRLEDNFDKLKSSETLKRRQAARALGSLQNKKAVSEIIFALKKEITDEVKIALIDSLGILKSTAATSLLIEKAKKETDAVRICAIIALGKITDTEIIPELKKLLKDKSPQIRCYAAGALRKQENKDGLKIIIEVLKTSPEAALSAIKNLSEFSEKKAAESLIPFLKNKDTLMRLHSVWALGKTGNKTAVHPLLELLKTEKNRGILLKTIEALGKIGGEEKIASSVYPFLSHEYKSIALEAVKTLSLLENESGISYLVAGAKDEKVSREIQRLCMTSARQRAGKRTREEVIKALLGDTRWTMSWSKEEADVLIKFTSDKNEIVRTMAYAGLAGINIEKYWEIIKRGLTDKSSNLRKAIVSKIGDFKFNQGAENLKEFFPREEQELKKTILETFYKCSLKNGLQMGLSDGDFYNQLTAANYLSILGDNSGYAAVVKGLGSEDEEIRELALETSLNMKDTRIIPHLKNLQKKVKDKTLKKDIKAIIKAIKNQ